MTQQNIMTDLDQLRPAAQLPTTITIGQVVDVR
jgi:hypothetical protein